MLAVLCCSFVLSGLGLTAEDLNVAIGPFSTPWIRACRLDNGVVPQGHMADADVVDWFEKQGLLSVSVSLVARRFRCILLFIFDSSIVPGEECW